MQLHHHLVNEYKIMVAKEKHCQHNEDIVSPLPVGPLG